MATLFWVGGSNPYDGVTNRLATTSGGAATVAVINAADTVTFDANSPAAAVVTTSAAISCTSLTLNGFTGSLTMSNGLTVSGAVTHTTGTLNTNGQICSWGSYTQAAGTKTLTLGGSAISCNSWFARAGTTITANTATITQSGANSSFDGNSLSGSNYNGTTLIQSGSGTAVVGLAASGTITLGAYTRTGTAARIDAVSIGSNLTVTGTATLNSNSVINRLLVTSPTYGTASTFSAATLVCSNAIYFRDITGTGAATWTTGASGATYFGDCGGNTGITPTTSAAQTNTGAAGLWSDSTKWTSRVPLPQDDVSFSGGSGAITLDMPDAGRNIDFTNYSGTLTTSISIAPYGSVTFSSGMSYTGTGQWNLSGRTSFTTITSGKLLTGAWLLTAPGGTWTLGDAHTWFGRTNTFSYGSFDTAGYNYTADVITFSATMTSALLRSSVITIPRGPAGGTFTNSMSSGFNAGTSTIRWTSNVTGTQTFSGGNQKYYNVLWNQTGGYPTLLIAGNNYFETLNIGAGKIVQNTAGALQTIKNYISSGQNNGYQYIPTGTDANYISAPDSAALSITGDIDIRVRVAPDSWTPASAMLVLAKGATTGNQYSYALGINTAGTLAFYCTSTAAIWVTANSSTSTGFSAGATKWLRVTWRASDGRVQYFTAADNASMPSSWTQLGTDQTRNIGSIFDSTGPLEIGSLNSGVSNRMGAKYYWAQIRNNILDDGTGIQFDANFASKTFGANSFTESSSNAATVTMTGTAAQAGDGRVSVASSSAGSQAFIDLVGAVNTLDYQTVQGIFSTTPYKYYAGANSISISNNTNVIFTAPVTQPYIKMQVENTATATSGSATFPYGQTATAGNLLVYIHTSPGNPSTMTGPSGYTLADNNNGTASSYLYIWYKVASGGETGASSSWVTTVGHSIKMFEIVFPSGGTPALDVKDKNNSGASTVTTLSTGSGVTNTLSQAIAIAAEVNGSGGGGTVSLTNSFQESRTATAPSNNRFAALPLTSTGSQSTTFTWVAARVAAAQLVIFGSSSGASANGNLLMLMRR